MLTLQAVVSTGSPSGPAVEARHPSGTAREAAADLRDVPDYHPSYYADPLPLPPRVCRPMPRLGRIVWPCWGITRYAVGHLLMDSGALEELEAVAGYDGRVLLTLSNADEESHTLSMRIVARRPLNDEREEDDEAIGPTEEEAGPVPWVVTLVDQRHDRSGKVCTSATAGTPASWGDLIHELADAAGYTILAVTVDALLTGPRSDPDPDWWEREKLLGRSACVLADAACAAIGLRIAVAGDGSVTIQDAATADTALGDWWAIYGTQVGGGGKYDQDRERPATVTLAPSGGTPISTALPDGVRGDLSLDMQPLTDATDATAMVDVIDGWFALDPPCADFRGHVPVPASSLAGVMIHDTDRNTTGIVRDPVHYPWPLAGYVPAAGGGSVAYWSTTTDGILDLEAQTGRGRKTTTRSIIDGSRGAWWTEDFYATGDDTTTPYVPYHTVYTTGAAFSSVVGIYSLTAHPYSITSFLGTAVPGLTMAADQIYYCTLCQHSSTVVTQVYVVRGSGTIKAYHLLAHSGGGGPGPTSYAVYNLAGSTAVGAHATVSGLVFSGGLYVSGTLTGIPAASVTGLATVATTGAYSSLTGTPALLTRATLRFSGSGGVYTLYAGAGAAATVNRTGVGTYDVTFAGAPASYGWTAAGSDQGGQTCVAGGAIGFGTTLYLQFRLTDGTAADPDEATVVVVW